MASSNSQISRAAIFSEVEGPERLLRRSRRTSSTSRREDRNEIHTNQLGQPPEAVDNGGENTFQVVADQVVSEECQTYFETALWGSWRVVRS